MSFLSEQPDGDWLGRVRQAVQTPSRGRIGPYEILEEIRRGGQGVVFRARQPGTSRDVALKRVLGGRFATDAARARFHREVRTAAGLNHPNIVTIFGVESIDEQPVLAMEWIDGTPIDRWAADRPRDEVLRCFLLVCDALRHAHQRGVIHRDLKPANIMVDEAGQPYVLDFGLAKLLEPEDSSAGPLTLSREFLGTPAFAAPEQLSGDPSAVDTRCDVYALGAVLYVLLTGRTPHNCDVGLRDFLEAVQNHDPPRPARISNRSDPELDLIVMEALARDLPRRYQSVDALAADLRRYLAGEPIAAHPPSALYQVQKLVGRHRLAFASAGLLVLLISAFAVVSTWQAFRLERQRRLVVAARASESDARAAAESLSGFFRGMLSAAQPRAAQGEDITVRDLVDQAVERLAADPIARPGVEAAIRLTLGQTLLAVGQHDEAAEQLEHAIELARGEYGAIHVDIAGALVGLGGVRSEQGDLDRAAARYAEGVAMYRTLGPEQDRALASALASLAIVHLKRNERSEARHLLEEAQQIRNADPETPLPESLHGALTLAALRSQEGQTDEAEALLRTSLSRAREGLGDGHELTISAVSNLGVLLRQQRRFEDALPLAEEARASLRRVFGENDLRTLRAGSNLALVLQSLGRFDEAETAYLDALDSLRTAFGAEHETTLSAAMNLASLWSTLDRFDEAEELLREVLAGALRVHGPRHPVPAFVQAQLGTTLRRSGGAENLVEAEELHRAALQTLEAAFPANHPRVINAREQLQQTRAATRADNERPGTTP